jgi:Holliday junction resolvase RusA-like endonuclease
VKHQIWVSGRGKGKQRPRSTKSGSVYMAADYKSYVFHCMNQISKQLDPLPNKQYKITCYFVNFKSSDADNLTGTLLDALVKAKLLKNDSSSHVVAACGYFAESEDASQVGVLIEIEEAEIVKVDSRLITDLIGKIPIVERVSDEVAAVPF